MAVAIFNQAHTLSRCLRSIVEQRLGGLRMVVVILDDHSTDDWFGAIASFRDALPMFVLQAECGTAALARNTLLDWVDAQMPGVRWVARLDADDHFADPASLASAVALGDARGARFVIGGNRLFRSGRLLRRANPATPSLMDPDWLLGRLRLMGEGTAENELPSCNLLLATGSGWRYPTLASAEDHWLVSQLLIHHSHAGAILVSPFYCNYSVGGESSSMARKRDLYLSSRRYLYSAAKAWNAVRRMGQAILGFGQEGIVIRDGGLIEKRFYPGLIDEATVSRLRMALRGAWPWIPEPEWQQRGDHWVASYPDEETSSVSCIDEAEAFEFLQFCLGRGLACLNIKRANFRRRNRGGLLFIDVGKHLVPATPSCFMDSAARMFAISVLGWPDGELSRRAPRGGPAHGSLEWLPGFTDFYRRVVCHHARRLWASAEPPRRPTAARVAQTVCLLIKACAMDAAFLTPQVSHIVGQLARPQRFARTILLLDPFQGAFLRQHSAPDWNSVLNQSDSLRREGVVDEVWVAPADRCEVAAVLARWFGMDCYETHTQSGVPLAPQLWAFEKIPTRYVLQCDVDVLVGRRDVGHDYLAEMLAVIAPPSVLGAAFNIAHAQNAPPTPWDAPPGDYVPEVRCGLLDLDRLMAQRPLPNAVVDGKAQLTWYRSVQERQHAAGLRTLRGGDPRTFYVHPTNHQKLDGALIARVRDLVGQGLVPDCQLERWDLAGTWTDWSYPRRPERLVFLGKGRNTSQEKLERWMASLLIQEDQDFGVIVIDDASDFGRANLLPDMLRPFGNRLTLVRNAEHQGRIPNFRLAVRSICSNPDSLIAVVDLDDGLMSGRASRLIKAAQAEGVDLLWGAMFRPDKPLKTYHPSPQAVDLPCAGDVWTHLRAFKKRLFESIPEDVLRMEGDWIAECTDYATMVPMARLATNPRVLDEYLCFHERSTASTAEVRRRKEEIIKAIISMHLTPRGEALA